MDSIICGSAAKACEISKKFKVSMEESGLPKADVEEDGHVYELCKMPEPIEDGELVVDRTDACFDYDYDTDDEWVVEADRPAYRLYVEDFKKSQGFDIDHYFLQGGLQPFHLDRDDGSYVYRDLKPSVEAAIAYKNAKHNWNLQLVKITKCNYAIGSHYYATFDALDRDAGFTRSFQAELIRDHFSGKTEIYRFRVKPDSAIA